MTRSIGISHGEKGVSVSINQDDLGTDMTALQIVGGMLERAQWARSQNQLYGVVTSGEFASLNRVYILVAAEIQARANREGIDIAVASRKANKRKP